MRISLAAFKHVIAQLFLPIKTRLLANKTKQRSNRDSKPIKQADTASISTLVDQYLTKLDFKFTDENKRKVPVDLTLDNTPAANQSSTEQHSDTPTEINSLDVHHFSMHISNQQQNWGCLIRIIEAHQLIAVYSILPIEIPKPLLPVILTLVSRLNYDLIIGNFELDLNDGELRFKTSLDVEASPLTLNAFRHLLYSNLSVVSRYFSAFEQALAESKDIVTTLDTLEKQLQNDNKKSAKGTTTKGYYIASDEVQ